MKKEDKSMKHEIILYHDDCPSVSIQINTLIYQQLIVIWSSVLIMVFIQQEFNMQL